MDKLMLGAMSTKEEVGFYTYAERITQIPNTLILALDSVIMPRMSNLLAKKDSDTAVFLMDNVMMFAMLMAAAMSFGLAAVGTNFCSMVLWRGIFKMWTIYCYVKPDHYI